MNQEFVGKVALVTGASKGIGAGIAKAFGHVGAKVAVAYARDRDGENALPTRLLRRAASPFPCLRGDGFGQPGHASLPG